MFNALCVHLLYSWTLAAASIAAAQGGRAAPGSSGPSWKHNLRAQLAEKNYAAVVEILNQERQRYQSNSELENLLGATLERAGRSSEATAAYARALQLHPQSSTIRLNLALNRVRLGQFDEAAAEFTRLLKDAPLGNVREPAYQQSPDDDSISRFVEKVPAREQDWRELGMLFLRHGRLQGAQAVLARALGSFPESAQLHYGLGWALQEGGKFEAAREAFQRALELNPAFAEAALRLAYSYSAQGKYAEAVKVYEGILHSHPQSYEAHYFLAECLVRMGGPMLNRAITLLQKAVALNAGSFDSHVQLGRIFLEMGRPIEAQRELEQALSLNPELDGAHYLLAQSYAQSGQSKSAAKEIEAFQRLKQQERVRAREMMFADVFSNSESGGTLADRVVQFIETYKAALVAQNFLQIWQWLTPGSREFYDDDPAEFARIASQVFAGPEVRQWLLQSRLSGGKQVAGRVLCEFEGPAANRMPPLVLLAQGAGWKIDYAFDWTKAGLGYLGAR